MNTHHALDSKLNVVIMFRAILKKFWTTSHYWWSIVCKKFQKHGLAFTGNHLFLICSFFFSHLVEWHDCPCPFWQMHRGSEEWRWEGLGFVCMQQECKSVVAIWTFPWATSEMTERSLWRSSLQNIASVWDLRYISCMDKKDVCVCYSMQGS